MAETDNKRRIDVMVSSTFLDMKECRAAVIQAIHDLDLNDRCMEGNPAPDADDIDASLQLVEAAHIYVGLLGPRYGGCPVCPDRNPDGLSLTELEFDHARTKKIPRVMFEISGDYSVPFNIVKDALAEGDEGQRKREAFRAKVKKDRVLEPFDTLHQLQTKATSTLTKLKARLERQPDAGKRHRDTMPDETSDELHALNAPYVMQRKLVGRKAELARIDAWAKEPGGGMLLFRAIGGMGKSALTWHWAREQAEKVRGDWAGRLWYSFYIQGATLRDFLLRAMSHIRNKPPEDFKGVSSYELGTALWEELNHRPWLIVLDGLERVLVAYNRPGKEAMSDEDAEVDRDGMGLERGARTCVRPDDDHILAMLAQVTRGKVLVSSRLLPEALTEDGAKTIPGVEDYRLEGLAKEDGAQLLIDRGVKAHDRGRVEAYLERTFACHPLSVLVIPGVMRKLQPFGALDFDAWVDNKKGGREPGLTTGSLRGKQNHILKVAFDALNDDDQALLTSLTLIGSDLTYEIVILLNPKRPPEPKSVEAPKRKSEADIYSSRFIPELSAAFRSWKMTSDPKERRRYQAILDRHIDEDFDTQKKLYNEYRSWPKVAEEADQWLSQALVRLTDHGLIQYDASQGELDIHPAVRYTAQARLTTDGQQRASQRIADALATRAKVVFEDVDTVAALSLTMDRVRALCAGGQLNAAAEIYGSGVDWALFRLGASPEALELLRPFFPDGWGGGIAVSESKYAALIFNDLGHVLNRTGQQVAALDMTERALRIHLRDKDLLATSVLLSNLAVRYRGVGKWFVGEGLYLLASNLADAVNSKKQVAEAHLALAGMHLVNGRINEARAWLNLTPAPERNGQFTKGYMAERAKTIFSLARYGGEISEVLASETLKSIREWKQPTSELSVLENLALWRQESNRHDDAIKAFDEAIALGRRMGHKSVGTLEAARTRSLFAIKRPNDAERILEVKLSGCATLAELCLDLQEQDFARKYALEGYQRAWADGPPYCDHWALERCRRVLKALNQPEPKLPPFDADKQPPVPFKEEVEALIAKTLAERKEAERKKRPRKKSPTEH